MAVEAFDLAEHFQTPVFVMTDLDLGMNNWMSDPFPYPTEPHQPRESAHGRGSGETGRVRAVQGSGRRRRRIPHAARAPTIPRLPTSRAAAAITRRPRYTEREDDYMNNMDRLPTSSTRMRAHVPPPVVEYTDGAEIGVIVSGHIALRHAKRAATNCGANTALRPRYLRLKAYPFTAELNEFIRRHDRVYVVDQNRDGQTAWR